MSSSRGLATKPIKDMAHQTEALAASKGRRFFAYWMGPGTGKTRVTLKDIYRAYDDGLIDATIVLAPNNVKADWVKWEHMKENVDDEDAVSVHLREELPKIIKGLWQSGATGKDKKSWAEFEEAINRRHHKLIILAANYEALNVSQFFDFLAAFCKEYRVMIVADESTRIGKPGSRRTKRATKLADTCAMTRELSGTPIVKSPLKMYSQARFLDKNAMPFKSFYAFRNTFCIMGGFQGRQVLSYKNLPYLSDLIAKFSYIKNKDECLDLPPRVFLKRRVYMTPEQMAAYKTMREEFFANVREDEITANIVLAQQTRLAQITGGYLNKDGKIIEIIPPDRNPKLLEAAQLIEDAPGQVVVWFRFRPELEGMKQLLKPSDFFEFHGGVPEKDRGAIKAAFKRGDRQILLGTESTGGIGINQFLVADTTIHVSSDYDTEKRIQADDRTHRIGSEIHEKITYYDIMVPNTVDVKIHAVLRGDTKLSAKILRENWKEWI